MAKGPECEESFRSNRSKSKDITGVYFSLRQPLSWNNPLKDKMSTGETLIFPFILFYYISCGGNVSRPKRRGDGSSILLLHLTITWQRWHKTSALHLTGFVIFDKFSSFLRHHQQPVPVRDGDEYTHTGVDWWIDRMETETLHNIIIIIILIGAI